MIDAVTVDVNDNCMAAGMAPNSKFPEEVLAALSNKTETVIVVRYFTQR